MTNDRDIERSIKTQGGNYEETNNSGQYAKRDIINNNILTPQIPERTAVGTPNNLQARGIRRAGRFVGRDRELAQLDELLARSAQVVISSAPQVAGLVGMGGVGKTELAVQYARRCLAAERYPGGVVWLSGARAELDLLGFAQGALFPGRVLAELGDAAAQRLFVEQHWPGDGAVLLVVDDVAEFGTEVEPWLPGGDRFRVLVTTRRRLAVESLDLEVLDRSDAIALLREIAGDRAKDEAEAGALCEWLGDLPLAIELVGSLLVQDPDLTIAALSAQLQTEQLRHEAIEPVEAAFEISWRRLSAGAQQLAMGLSLFGAAPIPWELVPETIGRCRIHPRQERKRDKLRRWLTRTAPPRVEQWCLLLSEREERTARRSLMERHLLARVGEEQYGLHPLVREFFSAKLGECAEATNWRRAFAVTLTEIAKLPQVVTLERQEQVRAAMPHVAAATAYTELLSDAGWFWLWIGLARYYEAQSLFESAERCLQQCLEASEARCGRDHPNSALSLNNLAELYRSQEKYNSAESLYQRALEIDRTVYGDNHREVADDLNNLAGLYYLQGKYKAAEPLYQRSLEIREQQLGSDHPDTAQSLNNLALLHKSQGQYELAKSFYQRALEILKQQFGEDHPNIATSLNNLAWLYHDRGQFVEALSLFQRALAILQKALGEQHPHTQDVMESSANVSNKLSDPPP